MKHLFLKTTLLFFTITLSNCEEQTEEETWNPQLPPITQNGANTFGAIVDGRVFAPKGSRTFLIPMEMINGLLEPIILKTLLEHTYIYIFHP